MGLRWLGLLGVGWAVGNAQSLPAGTPPGDVVERQIVFFSDGLQAPGTLTFPAKTSRGLPIVVMVQGSGVQDRDETIGANKVFQQMAWALAASGVASLRYDRRPKFDLASFKAHPDLDHEVVLDAVAALAYVTMLPEVDPAKVFYLGHSLGAELGPDVVAARLAQKPGSVRGMIFDVGCGTAHRRGAARADQDARQATGRHAGAAGGGCGPISKAVCGGAQPAGAGLGADR
jgi:dienelactone hydrolase